MRLSYSGINRYTTCPRQYKYYYVDGYRPVKESAANLKFGSCIHKALQRFFTAGEHPVEVFEDEWMKYKDKELQYSSRDNFELLLKTGKELMKQFMIEITPNLGQVLTVEDGFYMNIDTNLDFNGYIDLVIKRGDENILIDFKTASRKYDESKVFLDEQLTAYYLASKKYRFDIDKVAFCVFVKTKKPYIQWLEADRNDAEAEEFQEKVKAVCDDILQEKFYKNIGMHCSWCDFLPLCLKDEQSIKENLIQIEQKEEAS